MSRLRVVGVAVALAGAGHLFVSGCGQVKIDERVGALRQADIVIDPTPSSDDQWFPIGPAGISNGLIASASTPGAAIGAVPGAIETTGRASVVASNPSRPLQFWVGTPAGGLWQSEVISDSTGSPGTTPFELMFDGWPAIGAIALDADACDSTRCSDLFVGTGEGKLRRQTLYGVGVFEGKYVTSGGEFPTEGYRFSLVPGSDAFTGGSVNDIVIDKTTGSTRLFATVVPGTSGSPHTATVTHPPPSSGFGVFRFDAGATAWVREDVPLGETPNRYIPGELIKVGSKLLVGVSNRGLYQRALSGSNTAWCPLNPGAAVPAGCPTPVASCTGAGAGIPCGLPAPGSDDDPPFDRITVASAPGDSTVLYATFSDCSQSFTSIDADPIGCALVLFRSTNGGVSWANTNATGVGQVGSNSNLTGSQIEAYSWYSGQLAVSPADSKEVYYGGVGMWKSTDGGTNFSMLTKLLHPDHQHILPIGPISGVQGFLEANDGGFSLFTSSGGNFTQNRFPGTQFYSAAVHEIEPCVERAGVDDDCDGDVKDDGNECVAGNTSTCNTQNVMAGAQDNGILLYNGGRSWTTLRGGDGGDTIIRDSRQAFSTIQLISPEACTLAGTGCSTSGIGGGIAAHWDRNTPAGDAALFQPPFVEHAATDTLFFATDKVYTRTASQTSFSVLGGPGPVGGTLAACTKAAGAGPAGNCARGMCVNGGCRPYFSDVEQPLAISALAVARTDVSRVYAGLYDGSVYMFRSGAWSQILAPERSCDFASFKPPHLPKALEGAQQRCTPVTSLEVDPANADVLYSTFGGFGISGRHVRRFDNNATTKWATFSDGGLATSDLPAYVLRINPAVPSEMYVGTEEGVFKRKADANGWVRGFQFPKVPVYGIAVDGSRGRVYAATHGRGMYLQVKKPTLRVFEGWMASKDCPQNKPCIWDILVYGEGFQPSTTGPCRVDILTPAGAVCATGTFDGFSQNAIGVNGDTSGSGFGLLSTQGQLVSPDSENRAVIAACFNGSCVSDTKGTPTPLSNCEPNAANPNRTISSIQVTCPGNPPVISSVGANCPGLANPPNSQWNPSQFDNSAPGLPGAPAAATPAPAAPAPSTTIALSAILVADPPAQLCSVTIPYTPSEERIETLRRARDAFNSSPECQAKNVSAVLPEGSNDREDPEDDGFALNLKAPSSIGMSLHFAVQMGPGVANTCQTLSNFPGYRRGQLDIVDTTITTEATGARGGGRFVFQERTPLGICTISVPTFANDTGEGIANRVLAEYLAAAANPNHATCPLRANPRDLIIKGGNLITIASTGASVCWTDAGLGVTIKPDGVDLLDVPLSQVGILGTDGVEIRDRAQIRQGTGYGVVGSEGVSGVTLFPDANTGTIFSVGGVTMRDRAHVHGNVKTGQVVTRQNQTLIDGSLLEHAQVRLPLITGFLTDFPSTTGPGYTTSNGAPLTLSPGAFGDVVINANSTLNLRTGTYYFRSLDLEPQSTLKLDETSGPVRIYVNSSFIFRGSQVTKSGAHPGGYISFLGTGTVYVEAKFRGTLAAARGTIVVRSVNTPHIGAFFAKTVQVIDSGAEINIVPFTLSLAGSDQAAASCNDGVRNGTETGTDCGGSCGSNCQLGQTCNTNMDCQSNVCTGNVCQASSSCTESSATDMGPPGQNVTLAASGCLRVRDGYPSWWGTRGMRLESATPSAGFPVPFTWSNACTHSGGSGQFTAAWQSQALGSTSANCATLIDLTGSASSNVTLRYWAN